MRKTIIAAIIICSIFAGCASIGGLKPGGGLTLEVENKIYEQVWKAAVTVVSKHLQIVESEKKSGVIKSKRGAYEGSFSIGEVVGVFIQPPNSDGKRFTVEVVSKRKYKGDFLLGKDWGPIIREGIKLELNL